MLRNFTLLCPWKAKSIRINSGNNQQSAILSAFPIKKLTRQYMIFISEFIVIICILLKTIFCVNMNRKLLFCGAIAAAILLISCVKKEAPKEDEQDKAATTEQQAEQPAQFENLQSAEPSDAQQQDSSENTEQQPAGNSEQQAPSSRVEMEHQETDNTSTTIRREYRDADSSAHREAKPAAKAESARPSREPSDSSAAKSGTVQSEDDAVAAAIAAATPALKN